MKTKGLVPFLLLGLVLLQYQNCAQPGQNFDQDIEVQEVSSEDGVNSAINPVEVGGVYFPQEKVVASGDEEQVSVVGACDQSGALISWTLKNRDGSLIERGLSECDQGSFVIDLSDEWQKHCDDSLYLKASLGAKASSETEVEPLCE